MCDCECVTTCMCECAMGVYVYVCVARQGCLRGTRALQSEESAGPFSLSLYFLKS